jgi:hypothetical protein
MKFSIWEIIFACFAVIGLILVIISLCRKAAEQAWDEKQPMLSDSYLREEHPNKGEKRDDLTDKLFFIGLFLLLGGLIALSFYFLFVEHGTF